MTDDQAVPLPPDAPYDPTTEPEGFRAYMAGLKSGQLAERERLQHRIDALLARHNHLPVWLQAEIGKLLDGTP